MKENELMEFRPESQLVAERTPIARAAFPVIDAHTHLCGRFRTEKFWMRYDIDNVVADLRGRGIAHIVALELYTRKHWDYIGGMIAPYGDFISRCAPISPGLYGDDFEQALLSDMTYYYENGAKGFKVWKTLGLSVRNADGILLRLTDKKLSSVWRTAGEMALPVVIHVGDPPAFFQPADLRNERYTELAKRPDWSYTGTDCPSYEELQGQFEQLLCEHPGTIFIAAHMAGAAHNLDYVETMLDTCANLYVDTAAVLSELGRQPRRFKRLAEKHANRILFGTDFFAGDALPHEPCFRFMQTEDEYFPYDAGGEFTQGMWNIYGCKLAEEMLQKIYYENAAGIFKLPRGRCAHEA